MYWTLPLRGYQRSLAISMKHKALTVCAQSPMAGILAIFRKNVLFLELYHWGLGLNMVLSCLCSCFNEQIDRTAMRFYSCYLVLETPTAPPAWSEAAALQSRHGVEVLPDPGTAAWGSRTQAKALETPQGQDGEDECLRGKKGGDSNKLLHILGSLSLHGGVSLTLALKANITLGLS